MKTRGGGIGRRCFSVLPLCQLYALFNSNFVCVERVKGVVIQPNINAGFPHKNTEVHCAVHYVEKSRWLFSKHYRGVSAAVLCYHMPHCTLKGA